MEAQFEERFLLVDIELSEDLGGVEQMGVIDDLLDVPAEERKVENQRQPVPVDQKQKGEESVDGGFGNDVSVEAVAEIDGVNVIALQIAVHDGEEDLEEQVDGIDQHRQQKQPCFARHHGRTLDGP